MVHVEKAPLVLQGHGVDELTGAEPRALPSEPDLEAALQRLHRLVLSDVTEFEESRTALGAAPIARVVSHVRVNAPSREIAQLAGDLEVVRPKWASLVPVIEPPCPRCVETRRESGGLELWCEQHRAHHDRRHTYHQTDHSAEETNFPLVFTKS